MFKRTNLLILILVVITVTLLYFALRSTTPPQSTEITTVTPEIERTAVISFNPSSVQVKTATAQTAQLVIDSGGKSLTGVQAVLLYDPKIIKNVTVTPVADNNFFGNSNYTVLKNTVDDSQGKATFIIVIPPTGHAQKGMSPVATVTFTPAATSKTPMTLLSFTAETKVTSSDTEQSILKSVNPLTVYFAPPSVTK